MIGLQLLTHFLSQNPSDTCSAVSRQSQGLTQNADALKKTKDEHWRLCFRGPGQAGGKCGFQWPCKQTALGSQAFLVCDWGTCPLPSQTLVLPMQVRRPGGGGGENMLEVGADCRHPGTCGTVRLRTEGVCGLQPDEPRPGQGSALAAGTPLTFLGY